MKEKIICAIIQTESLKALVRKGENVMYQTGDRVVYGIHGVCDIIGLETQMIDRKEVTYLVLEPLAQPGSRYMVPSHNPAAMAKLKKMMTREELDSLIRSESVRVGSWISDESQRKQIYRELIGSGDRERLISMICTLYRHKAEQTAAGRKVHLCDDNFLRDAEKLLISEVSVVMDMDMDTAKKFIRTQLKNV